MQKVQYKKFSFLPLNEKKEVIVGTVGNTTRQARRHPPAEIRIRCRSSNETKSFSPTFFLNNFCRHTSVSRLPLAMQREKAAGLNHRCIFFGKKKRF